MQTISTNPGMVPGMERAMSKIEESKTHEVWVVMGEAPEEGTKPDYFTFNTEGEANAFLQGLEFAIGWQDFQVVGSDGVIDEDGEFIPEDQP